MTDIAAVINELNQSFADFKKANDARISDIEKKGSADPLLTEQVDKISARINELEDVKSRLEKAETALARRTSKASAGDDDLDTKAAEFAAMCAKRRGVVHTEPFGAAQLGEYKRSFVEFMRKGDIMSLDALKALSVGSDPDGGYVVAPDVSGRIVSKIYETSPMRSVASVQVIGTDSLEGLYDLGEASAGWVGETGARTETGTPQIGKWSIPVHEIYANPAATQKMLDDAQINIEMWLADKVADKFARTENAAFVSGDGIGKPRGFLTYASGTTLPGTIEQVISGANGGFTAAGAGADALVNLVYALKQAYRSGARFFMPRSVVAEVRKLKDSSGAYIWSPGIAAGQAATLLGFPIIEMEDMPTLATGSLSLAFGNMSEAYQIVDRQGVRVLRDPFSNKPYVHFYTTKRTGGAVVNFEAVKLMKFSA